MGKYTLLCTGLLTFALPAWVQATDAPALDHGAQVFQKWCAPCHAPGVRHPGTLSLQTKYQGALPAALEERRDLSAELITARVRGGINSMPTFRKTEISDAELKALAEYLTRAKP